MPTPHHSSLQALPSCPHPCLTPASPPSPALSVGMPQLSHPRPFQHTVVSDHLLSSLSPYLPILLRCCCHLGKLHPCSHCPTAGFPAMPPIWALGFHLCRWGYGSSNETWQTVRAMRNYQIPQVTPRPVGQGVHSPSPIPEPHHPFLSSITHS